MKCNQLDKTSVMRGQENTDVVHVTCVEASLHLALSNTKTEGLGSEN